MVRLIHCMFNGLTLKSSPFYRRDGPRAYARGDGDGKEALGVWLGFFFHNRLGLVRRLGCLQNLPIEPNGFAALGNGHIVLQALL